jgi:hypothetical protein
MKRTFRARSALWLTLLAAPACVAVACGRGATGPSDGASDVDALREVEGEEPEPPQASETAASIRAGYARDGSAFRSPALSGPTKVTRVGVLLDLTDEAPTELDPGAPFEACAVGADGAAGACAPLAAVFHEGQGFVLQADLPPSEGAQLLVPASLVDRIARLTWSVLVPAAPADGAAPAPAGGEPVATSARPLLTEALRAGGVLPRSAWGARPARASCSRNETRRRLAVHHTVTARTLNGDYPARLRQFQAYHMDTRNYCDVGYHFLVTDDGRVWEGRESKHLGSHVLSHNVDNAGVAFVGCFHPTADCAGLGGTTPTDASVRAAGKVLGILAEQHGIDVSAATLKGHRDHPGTSTACPGDGLHAQLPRLRTLALEAVAGGAPACEAAFDDICGSPHRADVEALASRGVVAGCTTTGESFCPGDPVTRGQMATLLAKALALPAGPDRFTDDDASPHQPGINAVAAAGISAGCNAARPDRFCPNEPISRGQLAALLAKAFALPAGPDAFGDDAGSPFEAAINAVAAAGIASGCDATAGKFCPDGAVTRGQMATFLRKALDR